MFLYVHLSGSSDFLLNVESSSLQNTHFPEIMIFTCQKTILTKIYIYKVNDTDFITQPPASLCVSVKQSLLFYLPLFH